MWKKLIDRLDTYFVTKIINNKKPNLIIWYDESKKQYYMKRWYIIRRNKFLNIYLHQFKYPDDNDIHDHPWFSIGIVLWGFYREQHPKRGVPFTKRLNTGNIKFRSPWYKHRIIEVNATGCRTLFITGPVIRTWGFHTKEGWMPHNKFKIKRNWDLENVKK